MIIVFFLVGGAVLLRARMRDILVCAAVATGLFLLAAVTVTVYIGTTVPTNGFGAGFNFAGPAVVTQNWTHASVALATAVTLVLLAVWIGFAFVLRRLRPGRAFTAVSAAFGVCVAAVSLVAVAQMTSHISHAEGSDAQEAITLMKAGQVRPDDQIAVAPSLGWMLTVPQAFEVSWTELKHFKPGRQPLPADTTVVETGWPAGKPARAGWPDAPAGWRIVASNQNVGWVVWRQGWAYERDETPDAVRPDAVEARFHRVRQASGT